MGVVKPNPTFSHSSTAYPKLETTSCPGAGPSHVSSSKNPSIISIEARQRLQARAEAEAEEGVRNRVAGREFLDIVTISKLLAARDQGSNPAEIESLFLLKQGTVGKLGPVGLATPLAAKH